MLKCANVNICNILQMFLKLCTLCICMRCMMCISISFYFFVVVVGVDDFFMLRYVLVLSVFSAVLS
jgi:hypothetical protein